MASKRKYDINGWYEIKENPLSKVGVFQYPGSVIDFNGEFGLDPNKLYNVLRPAEELSDPETIESFKLVPWINNHVMLGKGPGMMEADKKGVNGVIGESVFFDEKDQILKGNVKVFGEELEKEIDNGKEELSLGYRCVYERKKGIFNGQSYDFVQRCIRGNHLALVDQGRMGPDIAVLDSNNFLTFTIDSKEFIKIMTPEEMEKAILALMETVKSLTEKIDSMDACGTKKTKDADGADADGADADGADADGADADGADADPTEEKPVEENPTDPEKKTDSEGMDSIIASNKKLQKQVKDLTSTVDSLKKDGTKIIMGEISKRNSLAEKVSWHIGTFDHSEMTLNDVAVYAVEKLGLTCDKGTELPTLNGFLYERKSAETLDSKKPEKMGGLDDYINDIDGK